MPVHEIFLAMEMMIEMFQTMNPSIIYEMQKYHPGCLPTLPSAQNKIPATAYGAEH
jgi:hypothetical protein